MNTEEIVEVCLALPHVSADFPFDASTMVFRVGQKIFGLMSLDTQPVRINLKCDPDKAVELRDHYEGIQPGYHMNKKHWNTVYCEDYDLSNQLIKELIHHSYTLVFQSLPKTVQHALNQDTVG